MTVNTTLAKRGAELADGPLGSFKDMFKSILSDPYSEKNPNGFVNIGTAENYAMIPEVKRFVNANLTLSNIDFTYGEGPWGSERLRKAVAKHMTKYFKAIEKVNSDDVLVANGVSSLCEMMGFTIFDQGDGLLLPQPIYQAFPIDFGAKAKVNCIDVPFGKADPFGPTAAEHFESALLAAEKNGTKVRAMMLCNPHNPLGQCYPKETIIDLMKFCNKYKIHILCDEIYAASVYEIPDKHAVPFTSVLSFDYTPYISSDYVHVLYGMSKDFAGGGLRLGFALIRNKQLMRAMSAINAFHWSGNPNQEIATLMLEDEKWADDFLKLGRQRLSKRNKLTRSILDKMGIKYHHGANAGFFIWADFRLLAVQGGGGQDSGDGNYE